MHGMELRRAAALLAVAAVIAACAAPGAGSSTPPAATNPPAGGLTIELRNIPTLGAIVVGEAGRSLYVFTNDSPGTTTCVDDCAASWPPLVVASASDAKAGDGVGGAIGTVTRSDGTTQVTLGGAPLYYFAGDSKAGDGKGQGLGGVWFFAGPAGGPVGAVAPSSGAAGASPTPCTGRSCY